MEFFCRSILFSSYSFCGLIYLDNMRLEQNLQNNAQKEVHIIALSDSYYSVDNNVYFVLRAVFLFVRKVEVSVKRRFDIAYSIHMLCGKRVMFCLCW